MTTAFVSNPGGGGGGNLFTHLDRGDFSVNNGRVENAWSNSPVLHTQPGVNNVGGFNGGGTGNKAILGIDVANLMPLGLWTSLAYTFRNMIPYVFTPFKTYTNLLVDVNGDGSLYKIFVIDPSSVPALVNGTVVTNGDGSQTVTFDPVTQNVLIVNDLVGVVPIVNLGPSWTQHGYRVSDVLLVYPNARFIRVSTLDGGLPNTTITPAFMLIIGDSNNQIIHAQKLTGIFFNGAMA